jgi:hypothetical protein
VQLELQPQLLCQVASVTLTAMQHTHTSYCQPPYVCEAAAAAATAELLCATSAGGAEHHIVATAAVYRYQVHCSVSCATMIRKTLCIALVSFTIRAYHA